MPISLRPREQSCSSPGARLQSRPPGAGTTVQTAIQPRLSSLFQPLTAPPAHVHHGAQAALKMLQSCPAHNGAHLQPRERRKWPVHKGPEPPKPTGGPGFLSDTAKIPTYHKTHSCQLPCQAAEGWSHMQAHSAQGQNRRAEGTGLPGSRPDRSPLVDQGPLWKATPSPTDPSPRMALVTAPPGAPRPRGGFQRGGCGPGALPTPLNGPNSPGSACGGHLLPATSRMRTIQPEYPSMTLTHMRSPRGTAAGNGKSPRPPHKYEGGTL